MKAARIVMFFSPIIYFLPPLLPVDSNVALGVLNYFFKGILRGVPWNLLMGFLCYTYARHLGREAYLWAMGSFMFPFLTPLVLAFMSHKHGSSADLIQQMKDEGKGVKGLAGSIAGRLQLLERCLQGKPDSVRAEQILRFSKIRANYEFLLTVNAEAQERLASESAVRKLTLWAETPTRIYGAGVVQPKEFDETGKWLCRNGNSGEKLIVTRIDPEGAVRFHEYYIA